MDVEETLRLEVGVKALGTWRPQVVEHDPEDGEHVVPGELRRFLARLRLLHGIPFCYLVPDATLLPAESIRFFYLDRAWTDALEQGVLSVGTVNTGDRAELEAVYPSIRADVDEAEREIRPSDEPQRQYVGSSGTVTGFLLRSRVVSGWPGLHVRAYRRDVLADDELTTAAESDPERMKLLRVERLAPAVLLVLIDGVPEVIHIEEPRQGLQFGARLNPADPPGQRTARVKMRNANDGRLVDDDPEITDANSVPVPFRPGAPGVLDMRALRDEMANFPGSDLGDTIEPQEFALEMLRFPFRQVFGDPDDTEAIKFYDLDRFTASTTSLVDWKAKVTSALGDL